MSIPTATTSPSPTRRLLGSVAATTVAAAAIVGFLAGSGSALAPEPADLSDALSGSTGATGAAVLVSSQTPTTVVIWPATYSTGSSKPAAGTPCSTYGIAKGERTTKVIVLSPNGVLRKCV